MKAVRDSRVLRRAVLGATGICLLASAAWTAWWFAAARGLHAVEEEIRAAGLPLTAEEILAAPVADADNAAPLLERAAVLLKQIKTRDGFIDACPGASSPERAPERFGAPRLEQLHAQLTSPEVVEILAILREASRRPAARFERDYGRGPATDVGPLTALLDGARLLGTAAWLEARDGEASAAAADLTAVSRLAGFALDDVLLISWLIGMSVDDMSVGMTASALAVLPAGLFQSDEWRPLGDLWEAHNESSRSRLAHVIDGERILAGGWIFDRVLRGGRPLAELYLAANPSAAGDRWMNFAFWSYQYPLRPLLIDDHAAYLRFMLGLRRAAGMPSGEGAIAKLVTDIPRTAFFTRLTAPALEGVLGRSEEYRVRLQLGGIGLELEDFRARNGAWPGQLDELGLPPGALVDPFGGKRFPYEADNDFVSVRSVGRDGIDDGGRTAPRVRPRDIVWRVGRAPIPR
jgi:hypothetical protein